jgi:hypothetical protein
VRHRAILAECAAPDGVTAVTAVGSLIVHQTLTHRHSDGGDDAVPDDAVPAEVASSSVRSFNRSAFTGQFKPELPAAGTAGDARRLGCSARRGAHPQAQARGRNAVSNPSAGSKSPI